ncbi:unnamed protein product (macronuclear) [Paramecium tetraurelia]|uniref:Uncharacterized protein n=1 Tax=Paramecium tetraurelia TaxID=5888 RepID=A0BZJ2_PARTE|nr:uncharacterized protein GSPATT00033812001 [Paramecium tetraurelia]CAK63959.1 unnamed protein product [Paramecium tetraurelia]|eukprot:XP_001431357.1 hypothetical protein (macronuclear) [Paramecium tetraurelia strain d4-2]
MRVGILLLAILMMGTMAQDNEVVIQLLTELRQEAVDQLQLLNARFQPIKQAKLDQIAVIQQAISEQKGECYKRQQDVEAKQTEIDLANEYKNWMKARQESNNNRIGVLSTNVCEKNNNSLNKVKNGRVLLRLIAYLRATLQAQLSTSFAEVKENTISEISHIVTAYKEYRKMNMLQTKQEEVELNGTIEQLIELLNQMEREIQDDIANGQNGQVQIGVTFSEFKVRIEKENDIFNRQIEVQDDLITHFQNQLTTLYGRVDKCESRQKEIEYTLLVAQEDLKYDQEWNDEDRLRLEEEIELFDWLIKHYQAGNLDEADESERSSISNDNGSTDGSANGDSGLNGDDRDGVIDYTPLKEVSNAWGSEEEGDNHENANDHHEGNDAETEDRGDVIDYTPYEEKDVDWDSLLQKKQNKNHHQSKKHHTHKSKK